MPHDNLVAHLQAYTTWRGFVAQMLQEFQLWMNRQELSDAQTNLRMQHLLERLHEDKLNVAFVAEFSRGKSELINAIFFAEYGQRLLPSSAGRTTMCPTELLWDEHKEPCLQLLPIETRASNSTTTEYKRYPDEWTTIPLDIDSPEAMLEALHQVSETRWVPKATAVAYGLYNESDPDRPALDPEGRVEVPAWRHALINFPHPLLKQGLVILDTPGLNAIGTEPELTLNLLPSAHAVLFILAADTGVTKTDIEVWRNHVSSIENHQKGRLVVLNKIDGMWDELKSADEIDREINKQVATTAGLLGVDQRQVYPVSAQKGLVGKVNHDKNLLKRSRLPLLEQALSEELIPSKHEIVRLNTENEIHEIINSLRNILKSRVFGVQEQLEELRALRGKNQDVIQHMMLKVREDKENFERGLQRFQALRSVFSQQTNVLFTHMGMDALKTQIKQTRIAMLKSTLTSGIREAMNRFFQEVKGNIDRAAGQITEIEAMMDGMYHKFATDHGINIVAPPKFSTLKFTKELNRLERGYNDHFNTTLHVYGTWQNTLMSKFFETVASRVVYVFEVANRDAENWLKSVMSPMETQVREHQLQLRRRLESVKRIHKATDTLEDRIGELEAIDRGIAQQIDHLDRLQLRVSAALEYDPNDDLFSGMRAA